MWGERSMLYQRIIRYSTRRMPNFDVVHQTSACRETGSLCFDKIRQVSGRVQSLCIVQQKELNAIGYQERVHLRPFCGRRGVGI